MPTPPPPGKPVSATLIRQLIASIRERTLLPGKNVRLKRGPNGTTVDCMVDYHGVASEGMIYPFAVRLVTQSDADPSIAYDGWEIYLPTGCVSVGSTCASMNPPAYRLGANGEEVVQPGWFRLPAPALEGEDAKAWPVIIHAKCAAAISGTDSFSEWPKQYVWAEMQKDSLEIDQSYREDDENDVGDAFSTTVGVVRWRSSESDGSTELTWSYFHAVKTPVNLAYTRPNFEIFTAFTVDEDDVSIALDRIFVRNMVLSAAGATFLCDGMTELDKDDEMVYLKISAQTKPYTAEIKAYRQQMVSGEVLTVPEQIESERQNGEIYELLYVLKNGHVVTNNLASLQNIQIYQ